MKAGTEKAFTLIELIMAIVIGAIILIPTSLIVVESVRNTFLPEYLTIASSLLEDRVEWITNLRFKDVTNETDSFTGDFSDYSYEVTVDYVNPGDLNTPPEPPEVTDYKRVQIAISHSGSALATATTLRTNN